MTLDQIKAQNEQMEGFKAGYRGLLTMDSGDARSREAGRKKHQKPNAPQGCEC